METELPRGRRGNPPTMFGGLQQATRTLTKTRTLQQEGTDMTCKTLMRSLLSLGIAVGTALAPTVASAQSGIASIYSGGRTANGEHASAGGLTAAHRTLPFGTRVRVTNKRNGRSVVVRINDRGPFVAGRVIDVTPAAAQAIGFSGLAPVELSVVN
jgi:rare lipoprotein A